MNVLQNTMFVAHNYYTHVGVMTIKFDNLQIFSFVCSDFGGGWVGQQKSGHCLDFEIPWKKWTLP